MQESHAQVEGRVLRLVSGWYLPRNERFTNFNGQLKYSYGNLLA